LKYSGTARYWSSYPPLHKEFIPLKNPPPSNSVYYKNASLIARLELVDALVCFTYSLWTSDYSRSNCHPSSWGTVTGFLNWTKGKWNAEMSAGGEREKAFLGIIWMIEGYIWSRKNVYSTRQTLDTDMDKLMEKARVLVEADSASSNTPSSGQPTPPMLPSPASIAPANSTNSTPTGRPSGTPNPTTASTTADPAPASTAPPARSKNHFGVFAPPPANANNVMLPISATTTHAMKTLTLGVASASWALRHAQTHLTLRTLAQHFPKTLARILHSSLSFSDEAEPDMEDEEGELFWPGAPETGEGLGWVCLLGKAMIKEFGKDIGYMGYDGVVPKPDPR
ncbi:hypothetical protein FA95DRAFT_1484601, partial [Auriscalpium vulgare]